MLFDSNVGVLLFTSTDQSSARYPAMSTFSLLITAYAGTNLDVSSGATLLMQTYCAMELNEFDWQVSTYPVKLTHAL